MNFTIFDTPIIKTIMRWLSIFIIKIIGWRIEGKMPDTPKCVMIAAPHTSNWDLPMTLFTAFILKAKIYWMGKDAIFRRPFGRLFKWLGGIPIDRSKSNGVVNQSIEQFQKNEKLIMVIPPTGTRSHVVYWKTGFYYIAYGAGVPIVLGFLDYQTKTGGIGPVFMPTGNIEADFKEIQAFYADMQGKNPVKVSLAVSSAQSEMSY